MQKQQRVVIERVSPQINGGELSIKRVVGQLVHISADILADGHDLMAASILYKHQSDKKWSEVRMSPGHTDDWFGTIKVEKQGEYAYKIEAWVDYALNWQYGIGRKIADGQRVNSELDEGVLYLKSISKKANTTEKTYLKKLVNLYLFRSSFLMEFHACTVQFCLSIIYHEHRQKQCSREL